MQPAAAFASLEELVRQIPDGASITVPVDGAGVALAATLALIRRGARGLNLITAPNSGLQADLLIGAGCVAAIETAGVTFGEYGGAPRFVDAVRRGTITVKDTTCPAVFAQLQAAEKGQPFTTLRGILGTDLLANRPDWAVIDNPFLPGDKVVALPAMRADIALFHAPMADAEGNVWIGRRRELLTMAHAAKTTLVTVEEVRDGSFLDDEQLAAGTIPAMYLGAVAEAKRGATPLGLAGRYGVDDGFLRDYVELARSEAGFARMLDRLMGAARAAAE
ncbi:CoA transferase subunit A [Desertibaculum subflavum]|uniref:CoA transferase subunit A n=1 Tax=Desertibaculum subflavum TaxID=2268458 RepID=UPI000E675575